jgi:tripartite-type tricarboxylate transporter receptor subunit TctC
MEKYVMRRILTAAALALGLALPFTAQAQNYPSQPVRLIIPFAPGGGSDILGRLTAEMLAPHLGGTIIAENKPGAGATIGADYVAKAKPDGYTLLFAPSDSLSIAPALKSNLPYKSPDDFSFIGRVSGFAYIITVNPKLPINNLKELVAYAKANPGKVRYGTSGVGGGPHLASALFAKATGVEMVHVPFNGTAPAITAAMGGHIDIVFGAPSLKSFVDAGSLRAIGMTGEKRHPDFPTVPTMAESGLPPVVTTIWWGLVAPAGTPEPVLAKLRKALDDMIKDPTTKERMAKVQYDPYYAPADEFKAFVIKDIEQWTDVAKSASIKID